MKINKSKGIWWVENKYTYGEPTISDDIAYYLYCKDRSEKSCIPQVAFVYFSSNKMNKEYFNIAKRILKINKIKKLNER